MAATDEALCEKLRAHGHALVQGCSSLPRIDGIGIGLTPSTDDYLLGLLAVGQACNLVWVERLEASVRTVLGNLAPVSRLMLEHALDGDYPEVVVRLFERRDRSALFDFMRHGETSGFDMLCGMLGALWISAPNTMQMIGAAGSL
ncbi:MAG: DUF2877 domain-containing protein [Adlercreutzia sp.]|nr:DUF2877 domain-containing protein [Adlercreutzia sp.]